MSVPSAELGGGKEALERLKSTNAPQWLNPSASLSLTARAASQYLFSSLKRYDVSSKSPFEALLVEGFDAEQIWQQIDLLSQPLLSSAGRQVRDFEKRPEEIGEGVRRVSDRDDHIGDGRGGGGSDGMDDDDDDDDGDEDDEEEERGSGDEDGERAGEEEEGGGGAWGIEDKFLKIKELEEFLVEDEVREYGLDQNADKKKKNERGGRKSAGDDKDEDEDEEEDGEDDGDEENEDEDNELGVFGDGDEVEDEDELDDIRYEDFFGSKKKPVSKVKSRKIDESEEESESDEESPNKKKVNLSKHEKELEKLKAQIEEMEKANLKTKHWTMRGEVTAANRPKNSALEVDLDFEHNVQPAPVITEEVSASLEEMIKNRILDGKFDDIQKGSSLPSTAPREMKELDENKSKKGLAEVYEEEYVQKTNPAAAPLSFSDEQKKEASLLFKKLCLKLDALSHFHFAPKPVVEDMTIQANVPALAMEEIAPVAVSDAAMLAPEEVFSGKGDIKEETELTQAERKRRRAKKKRKFKAEEAKRAAKKPRSNPLLDQNDSKED